MPEGITRGTPRYRRATIALVIAGFATFSTLYSVQSLMPIFSHRFSVGAAGASLALSMTTGVLAVTLFVAGLMSGMLPRKGIMTASLIASALLSLATAVAPNWSLLLALRALDGVALGGVPSLAITYLSEEVESSDLGAATGLYIGGTAVGGMGGRVIAGWIADLAGWRVALATLGGLALIGALVFSILLPPSRHCQVRSGPGLRGHFAPIAQHMRHPALPFVFAWGLLSMGAFVSIYNYTAYRLEAPPFNIGQSGIAAVFAIYILGVFSAAAGGRQADRFGRARVIGFGWALMCLGVAIMLVPHLITILAGMALSTIGFFAAHATASGWVGQLAVTGRGHAAGLYLLSYYIGSSVIGSAVGLAWTADHWPGVTWALFALLLIGAVVVGRLLTWSRRTLDSG